MKPHKLLKAVFRLSAQIKPSYFLVPATTIVAGTLHAQTSQIIIDTQGANDYIDSLSSNGAIRPQSQNTNESSSLGSPSYSAELFTILPQNELTTKQLDVDSVNYPEGEKNGAELDFFYGGNDYHETGGAGYKGNINISTSGGYATVLVGGNYGNAQGASFTGNTSLTITSDTFVDIAGASYLTHDVDSRFEGSTSVVVNDVLTFSTYGSSVEHSTITSGVVAGGHMGGLRNSSSLGEPTNNVITGDTNVLVDLSGHGYANFNKYITGGSAIYAGVDSTIEGKTNLTITNSRNINFASFVIGAGISYSKATEDLGDDYPTENSGLNKANIHVNSAELNIDSGNFYGIVVGGGFSASGGDVSTGNITSNITGGNYHSYIVGGSAIGNTATTGSSGIVTDLSVGKLNSENVVLNVSNINSNHIIVGGHLIGGPTSYDGVGNSSIGDVTVNIGGYNDMGQALDGSYGSIYGGSRIVSANSDLLTQGKVTVNLETGTIRANSEIAAAGHNSNKLGLNNTSSMSTEATEVKIGEDMGFASNVTVRGGYTAESAEHAYASTVTGNKQLHFDDASYSNLGDTHFYTFDEVKVVQESAHVQLEGNTTITTLDSELLTKSGTGVLSVEAGNSRGAVNVDAGRMNITTDQADSTVGTLNISSGATANTNTLTISHGEVKGTGLSANDVTGEGILLTQQIEVKQSWMQQELEVLASEQFSMITGTDVHLEALETAMLLMQDSSQLHIEKFLKVSHIDIHDYLGTDNASSPYITAHDMMNNSGNNFTFDFSSETITNMYLHPEMEPYLLADLDASALATADSKSFTFQINGVGLTNTQVIDGTVYYLGVINEDIYIYTNIIPEPTTSTLSLLALAGLLARKRRKAA